MNGDDPLLSGDDISDYRLRQFFRAYVRMSEDAKIRMAAPSDGFGNVQLSEEELQDARVLRAEALRYAGEMLKCDDDTSYELIGCVHGEWARAFAFTFEAAKLMFAGGNSDRYIKRLLRMALDEIGHPQGD